MRVLIADKFERQGIEQLQKLGCEVQVQPQLEDNALVEAVADSQCRVLIVRSTCVTDAMIRAGGQLGMVIRAGAGYNNIDVAAASRQSVFVANCPGKNAVAVAELTFGLILALDRRIPDNVIDLRQGTWAKKEYSRARGLRGRTLGIIGVGRIGAAVARRARAFEMKVIGCGRSLTSDTASELGMVRLELPEEVAAGCDILSVHLPATPDTRGIIGRNIFEELKPGSYFINTARSEVLDYAALRQAVTEKGIRAALDVFENEPGPDDSMFADDIVGIDGVVYGTHHIGASTDEAQQAVADETVAIVREYMSSGRVLNCVNVSVVKEARPSLVVRHRNRPGVLARVLGELSEVGINVREMENMIYQGEEGACARIRLDSRPDPDVLERIEASSDNILAISLTTPS